MQYVTLNSGVQLAQTHTRVQGEWQATASVATTW